MADKKMIYAEDLLLAIRDDPSINGTNFARVKRHTENAQAVKLVRCKDCEHFCFDHTHYCELEDGLPTPSPNDFCSYGERRPGE